MSTSKERQAAWRERQAAYKAEREEKERAAAVPLRSNGWIGRFGIWGSDRLNHNACAFSDGVAGQRGQDRSGGGREALSQARGMGAAERMAEGEQVGTRSGRLSEPPFPCVHSVAFA